VALALAVTWLGLGIAYFSPYPVGFWVTSLSFGLYVAVRLLRGVIARERLAPLEAPA
jgi:zinc/manganese transport system permease protein